MRYDKVMHRQLRLWLSGVLLIFVVMAAVRVDAQTKPPPAGMTQKQYDELVKSVGESVMQILRAKGLAVSYTHLTLPTKA